jgi:hypothetical protein
VYVNIGPLTGINDGSKNPLDKNLAGRLRMHFSSKLWYIHIGTSEVPVGLALRNLPPPISKAEIRA